MDNKGEKNRKSTCFDVPYQGEPVYYGRLRLSDFDDWVLSELRLAHDFSEGKIGPTSSTQDGIARKEAIMDRLDEAFHTRASAENSEKYFNGWREQFSGHLENPALVRNFEYFDIPSSDAMILFYIYVWEGNMSGAMDLLQNEAPYFEYKNLRGEWAGFFGYDDSWPRMSHFEAMNINERIKARELANALWSIALKEKRPVEVTSLGAGNLPERFWGLPECLYTCFDTSPFTLEPDDIFPVTKNDTGRGHVYVDKVAREFNHEHMRYFHGNFFDAGDHEELIGTQDIVVMHGLSMYLTEEQMLEALKLGYKLLRRGGVMSVDYLIMTASMMRVGVQGWPVSPDSMRIFKCASDADEAARNDLLNAQHALQRPSFDIEHIHFTEVAPWGIQSARVLFSKK